MTTFKAWISAFRLRTLPLSFSNIILGTALAIRQYDINYLTFSLILITTLLLQIISNLANDYGDAKKGTDNDNRVGPERAVQSGNISLNQMKTGIIVSSILALLSGFFLLYTAFKGQFDLSFVLFFIIGLLAIVAAIKYTVGKKAYGYSGMGDLFVFIFFGLVGVLGTYFLLTKSFELILILPAITMGGFSTAVLNLNNMRDIKNDAEVGKNTLVVKIGAERAKQYHYALFFWSYLSFITYAYFTYSTHSFLILMIPIAIVAIIHGIHLKKVANVNTPKDFDPELKKIALSSLLFSILIWLVVFFYIK
jgi:1,4-dihydroxy-2-naphthoate octaprenyltransferase